MSDFNEKTIVITGAARGIGRALAERLAAEGARVIPVDREPVSELRGLQVDLASSASIDAAARALPSQIDGIACVAGVPGTRPPEQVLRVNFLGLRAFLNHCLPRMPAGSASVFVSSVSAHRCDWSAERLEALAVADEATALAILAQSGADGVASYELSKRVLSHWVLTRLPAFARLGLRANLVSPGPVTTEILADFEQSMGKERIEMAARIAGRHASPAEIAAVIRFLLSDDSRWVNGTELKVDGGFHPLREAQRAGAGLAL